MARVNVIVRSRAGQRPDWSSGALRLAGGHRWYVVGRRRVWRPPTDVYETDRRMVVKVEIAGMERDGFDISFADRRLVIAGRRRDPEGKLIYQNMEIRYGEFLTEVQINQPVDAEGIEAFYEVGFLLVMLPKDSGERRIHVPVHSLDAT